MLFSLSCPFTNSIGEAYWPTVLGCLCSCYMLVSSSGKDTNTNKYMLSNIWCKYTKEGDAKMSIIGSLVQNNYETARQSKVGSTFLS